MRKWVVVAGLGVVVFLVAYLVTLHVMAPKLRAMARQEVEEHLQTQFRSTVHFDDFDVTFYPRIHVVVYGLVLRYKGRTDIPPLIQVGRVSFYTTFAGLLRDRPQIGTVELDGLQIDTPPRTPGGPPLVHGTDQDLAEKYPIVIGEILADNAVLVLLRKDSDKPPNQFEIHHLEMTDFGFDRPATFHALLTNPKPRGYINCEGQFGPWRADEPSETPVRANYTFFHADLGTIKGLGGILSSTGTFGGPLDYLNVEGTTDTPDFGLRTSAHPMALHTDFKAIVDGTNGDTVLTKVTAKFLHTTLVTHGEVVDVYPKVKGRTIALDAVSNDARIEDLLALAVKSDRPVMTGSAELRAKILIPERDEDLVNRLELNGQFGLGDVHFTSSTVQGKVDSLSRRGQGKPKDLDISDAMSDLTGRFKMEDGAIDFSNLSFGVEGASIALAGSYNLDSGQMDFRGKLRLEARLSQTMTGWKSVVLKPFNHFFEGKNGGAEIPIKITGTRAHPSFGLDLHDKANMK
jgi:AsmA-like C-terminal region